MRKILLICFAVLCNTAFAQIQEPLQEVAIRPPASNKLKIRVIMKFPSFLRTIEETSLYLLAPINYKLVFSPYFPEQTRKILERRLLSTHNDGSLKTIEEALLQISGDDTIIVVDHDHKLITFEFIQ